MDSSIIEDLLKNDDSDDEIEESDLLDIEQLLDAEDDDGSDSLLPNIDLRKSISFTKTSNDNHTVSLSNNLFNNENLHQISSNHVDITVEVLSNERIGQDDCEKHVLPVSLRLAEEREQRVLNIFERSNHSVLTLRKNSSSSDTGQLNMIILKEMSLISSQLRRNASFESHGPGNATSLCSCNKFIGIGTERGFILLFDHKQEIKRVFSHPVTAVAGSEESGSNLFITCIDCTVDGNAVVAGYKSGDIILWDCIKGNIIKHITTDFGQGEIRSLRFICAIDSNPQIFDSSSFTVICLTTNHVVNRYKVNRSMLSSWHVDVDCLLDDTAGKISMLSCLQPIGSAFGRLPATQKLEIRKGCSQMQIIALSFPHQTNVVQLFPDLKVMHRWKNQNDRYLPEFLVWNWQNFSSSSPEGSANQTRSEQHIVPCLTRSKGNKIEMLALQPSAPLVQLNLTSLINDPSGMTLPNSTLLRIASSFTTNVLSGNSSVASPEEITFKFSPIQCIVLDSSVDVLCIQWIMHSATKGISNDDTNYCCSQLLAVSVSEIYLLDQSLRLLEKIVLDSSFVNSLRPKFEMSPVSSVHFQTYPCLSVFQEEGYLMYPSSLWSLKIRSPFYQANELVTGGKWLEALSTIVDYVQRLADSNTSKKDIVNSNVNMFLQSEQNILRRYILNYALLALKRHDYVHMASIPTQATNHAKSESKLNPATTMMLMNRHHHIQLVANVCIEYCVVIHQFGLLYDEIYPFFVSEHAQSIFLEALEPFILNKRITQIPPKVITDFFTYAISKQKYSMIEKTIFFLSPFALELPVVLNILYNYQMFSSLLYLISYGYDCEFVGAVQVVMHHIKDRTNAFQKDNKIINEENGVLWNSSKSGYFSLYQPELGYKMMLYLYYTFDMRFFPSGDLIFSDCNDYIKIDQQVFKKRVTELLQFLVEDYYQEVPQSLLQHFHNQSLLNFKAGEGSDSILSNKYPYLSYFARIDVEALLVCLETGVKRALDLSNNAESTDNFSDTNFEEEEKVTTAMVIKVIHKIFLFSISHKMSSDVSNSDLERVPDNAPNNLMVRMFFNRFAHHMLSLHRGVFPQDLLISFVEYFNNQISATPIQTYSIEKKLQCLVQNQSKISLSVAKDWYTNLLNSKCYIGALGVVRAVLELEKKFTKLSKDSFLFEITHFDKDHYEERLLFYLQKSRRYNIMLEEQSSVVGKFIPVDHLESSSNVCFDYIIEQYQQLSEQYQDETISEDLLRCREEFEEIIISHIVELMRESILLTVEFVLSSQLIFKLQQVFVTIQSDNSLQYQFFTQLIHTYQRKHMAEGMSQEQLETSGPSVEYGVFSTSSQYQHIEHEINYLMGEYLSKEHIVTYVRLLAIYDKSRLFSFLVDFPEFCPIDESLDVAKEFEILDAMSFLYHRSGNRPKAIELICLDITAKVKDARRDIDNFLKQEKVNTTTNSTFDTSHNATVNFIALLLSRGHYITANICSDTGASRNAQISVCMTELRDRIRACANLERSISYLSDLCELHCRECSGIIVDSAADINDNEHPEIHLAATENCFGKAFDHLLQLRREYFLPFLFYDKY